ncbi:MAG: GFA family protein [Devosia sp.]
MSDTVRTGGCQCGAVRYAARGEPFKSGVCHCRDCKKVTGSSFLAYADWTPDTFSYTGNVVTYEGRSFCPVCGSRLFSLSETQSEVYLGTLDEAPSELTPQVEGWCIRRDYWLPSLAGLPQYERDIP